jgi:hypothetical protein
MEELFTYFLEGVRKSMRSLGQGSLYLDRVPNRTRLKHKLVLLLNQSPRKSDLGVSAPSKCNVVRCAFIEQYLTSLHVSAQMVIFRCSGVVVQESAARCMRFIVL